MKCIVSRSATKDVLQVMTYFAGVCLKRFNVAVIHTGRRKKLGVEISDEAVRLKRLYVTVDTVRSKSAGGTDPEDSL